ncbi:MAG: HD domain-containing protein [Planctomycetes bacterium]|nr:HD domain-containing protein [Planctomycetota bacterium]
MNKYMAINYDTLLENTRLGYDLYLKTYVKGVPRYVLFYSGDESFGSDRREELIRQNVKKLFISTNDVKKYFSYQEENLQTIISDKNKTSAEKSQTVYHVAKYLAMDLAADPRSGTHLRRVTKWVDNSINFIFDDESAFANLVKVTSHDYYTYTHCVNLAVFGLIFGKYLYFNPYELKCFGTGLLLHDIGKVEVPIEIINKPGKLTKEEFEIVKGHPAAGGNLLEDKNIDDEALKIVTEHHENFDGTGYPNRTGGKDIHLFGRIARIVDVYDAMTTKRTYADAKRPFAALMEMKEQMASCFDLELLKEFISFLGPHDSRRRRRKEDNLFGAGVGKLVS